MKYSQYHNHSRHSGGFALIEALITFIVLVVGILALVSFQSGAQKNTSEAKIRAEATSLAEAKVEELRSFLIETDTRLGTTVANQTGLDGDYTSSNDSAFNAALATTFNRSWSVSGTDLKTAVVEVSWTDRDGIAQSARLATVINPIDPAHDGRYLAKAIAAGGGGASGNGATWTAGGAGGGDTYDPTQDEDSQYYGYEGGYEAFAEFAGDAGNWNTLTISGIIVSQSGNTDVEIALVINVTEIEIEGVLYGSLQCTVADDSSSYECLSSYLDGYSWVGQITFGANKDFCISAGNLQPTYTLDFSSGVPGTSTNEDVAITQNLYLATNVNNCLGFIEE